MASTNYRPRFGRDIRIKPDRPQKPVGPRCCARTDCPNEGTHKVPKSRDNLNEHLWFCLEHARAHNESWDYFQGMSDAQIEAFRVAALTGHRPTWKIDGRGRFRQSNGGEAERYDDSHGVFGTSPKRCVRRRGSLLQSSCGLSRYSILTLVPACTRSRHGIRS